MAIGSFTNRRRSSTRVNRIQTTSNTTVTDVLLHELPGRRMHVHYWNQQIGEHDEAIKFDHNLPPEQLSYTSIEQLQLHIDSEIELNAVPDDMSGSAYIDAGMMPTVGDVFFGKMSGNTPALFTINNVERVIYNITDIYKVAYSLYKIITTDDDAIFNTLKLMSGEELVYDKEHTKHNTNPLVSRKQYTVLEMALKSQTSVSKLLTKSILKGQQYVQVWVDHGFLIDEQLSDFITNTVGGNMFDGLNAVQHLDIGIPSDGHTIWDLLTTDIPLKYVSNKYGVNRLAREECNTMRAYLLSLKSLGVIRYDVPEDNIDIYSILPTTEATTLPTLSATDYVFCDAFYNGNPSCHIERLVTAYINETQIDIDDLNAVCDDMYIWSDYERIYYLPILDLLLRYILSNRGGVL